MSDSSDPRWLLLIHQIPPRPSYLRVKIGRRLQALGSVAVKNSVYVLPRSEQAFEDYQWVRREIVAGGGDASVCEARFVDGLSDGAVESLFRSARDADYAILAQEAQPLQRALSRRGARGVNAAKGDASASFLRLHKRLAEVTAIDFFGAAGREAVEGVLTAIEERLRPDAELEREEPAPVGAVRGRTWVTRSGVHVDRIASAWLIRKLIDPEARFKLVSGAHHGAKADELRFDMFEAEFTHEGDRCTFEVLVSRFALADPSLRPIAEIVHDIDLKDEKFTRPETLGIGHLVAGIALKHKDDESRLREGAAVFESLYEYFKRKR